MCFWSTAVGCWIESIQTPFLNPLTNSTDIRAILILRTWAEDNPGEDDPEQVIGKIVAMLAPPSGEKSSGGNGDTAGVSPGETIQARLFDEWDVILTERSLGDELEDDLD